MISAAPLVLVRTLTAPSESFPGPMASIRRAVRRFPTLQVLHARVWLAAPLALGATADLDAGFGGHLLGYAETGRA